MEDKNLADVEFVKEHIGRKINFGYGSKLKVDEVYRSFVIMIDDSGKESTMSIPKVAEIIKEELRVAEVSKGYDIEQYIKDNGILTNVFTSDRQPGYDFLRLTVLQDAISFKNQKNYNSSFDKGNGFEIIGFDFDVTTNPPGSRSVYNNNYVCYEGRAEFRTRKASYQWAKYEDGIFFTNTCKEPNHHNHGHVHFSDTRSADWKKHTDMEIVHHEKIEDVYNIVRIATVNRLTKEIIPYMGNTIDFKESFDEDFEQYWFINRDTNIICVMNIKIEHANSEHEQTKIMTARFENVSTDTKKLSVHYQKYNIPKRCVKMDKEDATQFLHKTFNDIVDRWIFLANKNKLK